MRIKAFKNLSIGKLRDRDRKAPSGVKDEPAPEITEIEDKIKEKTGDDARGGERTQETSPQAKITPGADDIHVRPHGPAAELTVEPEDPKQDIDLTLDELDDNSISLGGEIKISEVGESVSTPKEGPAADVPDPAVPEVKLEDTEKSQPDENNDSLNNLFSDQEEEENPLASLVAALPDVTVQELMDDLEEIKRIIREWKPTSK
jgi:hypothetical protein